VAVNGVGAETPYGVPTFDGLEIKDSHRRLVVERLQPVGGGSTAEAEHWWARRFVATQAIGNDETVGLLEPVRTSLRREQIYRQALAAADGAATLTSAMLAAAVWGVQLNWAFLAIPLIAIFIGKVQGLYDHDDMVVRKSTIGEWRSVFRAVAMTTIGTYAVWWLTIHPNPHHGIRVFSLMLAAMFTLELPARAAARRFARSATSDERCLIVGCAQVCAALEETLRGLPGVDFLGTVPDDDVDCSVAGVHELVARLGAERIVIVPHHGWGEPGILKLVQSAKWLGIRVSLMPTVMTVVGATTTIDELDSMILLGVPRFGLSRSSKALKRSFDVACASLLLLTMAPVLALIALAVKRDSEGGALFRQKRIGRDGQPFTMYKFRSMIANAEGMKADLDRLNDTDGGLFKMTDDPRVTRVGRILRRTYLDELPQLLNVLRGDMSLVGPRPLIESEDAMLIGYDRHRSRLTPGMTGPWQLRGPIDASLSELAKLDYMYASNWSVWADIDIMLGTAARVFSRHGH
jgi:exopolysaccharide biosynthesis polyprenyl glycosylphosphotransferase